MDSSGLFKDASVEGGKRFHEKSKQNIAYLHFTVSFRHEIYIAFALHRKKFSAQTTREQIYFLLFTQIVENKRRKISSHFPPESLEFLVRKQENSQQKKKQILESHMHACRRRSSVKPIESPRIG